MLVDKRRGAMRGKGWILGILGGLAELALPAAAQDGTEGGKERLLRTEVVTVRGRRPLKEIGIQRTRFDSAALRGNVALSMADVLTFHSSIFVKSYGRATLATVAFRGTSPSHTQVTWNGMRINNPMLGMTDFSMIPAFFIDEASLLHGTSSVDEAGGGLGGAVMLGTGPAGTEGVGLQYIQGIGSFRTFDEFLRLTYGARRWQVSTRAVCASSPNDYKYRNRDKKENIYDEEMNIVGQYYPTERNRSGAYRDIHVLQEAYYTAENGDRVGLRGWYLNSNRELPMLTTEYGDETEFENRQREQTFRGVVSWERRREGWKAEANGGYLYTRMAYDYKRDVGNGTMAAMTRSRSRVQTLYGRARGEYYGGRKWLFALDLSAHQHWVESADKNIVTQEGERATVGYDRARIELAGVAAVKWRPTERFGMGATLRGEMCGTEWAPPIPALFVEGVVSERGEVTAKASVSRNFRFPTLNDLYFMPGGNPELRKEKGWTYDAGLRFGVGREEGWRFAGSATWFDSRIEDWIIWLPTVKGFFSPRNIRRVHAYGVEAEGELRGWLARGWKLALRGSFAWTPSINQGEPMGPGDRSVGKQLPYVPEFAANVTGRLDWRGWSLAYQWCWYSERFTMSSNELTLTGRLPAYYMNNVTLGKGISLRWAELELKGTIRNLFDEEYLSVLARPMPGINFEIFIGIKPKWGAKN